MKKGVTTWKTYVWHLLAFRKKRCHQLDHERKGTRSSGDGYLQENNTSVASEGRCDDDDDDDDDDADNDDDDEDDDDEGGDSGQEKQTGAKKEYKKKKIIITEHYFCIEHADRSIKDLNWTEVNCSIYMASAQTFSGPTSRLI